MTLRGHALAVESRRRQGLPDYVEDPATIARVVRLILASGPQSGPRQMDYEWRQSTRRNDACHGYGNRATGPRRTIWHRQAADRAAHGDAARRKSGLLSGQSYRVEHLNELRWCRGVTRDMRDDRPA
jgi:hypothetical protein